MPFPHDCKPVNDFLPFYPFMIKPQAPIHTKREENPKRNIIPLGSIYFFILPVDAGCVTGSLNCGFYTDNIFRLLPHQDIVSSVCRRSLLSGFWRVDTLRIFPLLKQAHVVIIWCTKITELSFENDLLFWSLYFPGEAKCARF